MRWNGRPRGLALLALLACAGCAGNGAGLDQNGQPIGSEASGASGPLTADLQSIQDNVFTPICTRCHIGASAPEGLRLDAADSYNLLVGVPSAEVPSVLRVMPGDPDESYLVLKLQGSAGIVGGQMPLGGPYLPQSTIDAIRQWITNGAPNSAAMRVSSSRESARAFAIVGTAPVDGAHLSAPVRQIVVAFNHEVDASLVNDTNIALEQVDMTDTATMQPLPVHAVLATGNPSVIVILPRAALAPGAYRVSVRGTGGGALADVDATALDGDHAFAFAVEDSP
jgi:methionine-rich copper-binding protein CopC